MTDDDWLADQQRAHNYRSFALDLPPIKPVRRRLQPFTLAQLLIAERSLERKQHTHD